MPSRAARRALDVAFGVALLALLVFDIAVRTVPALDHVFPADGSVRLIDTDSYYHLRHTQSVVNHYPSIQRWDIGTHFPRGQYAPMAGFFDLAMASAALLLGAGSPSPELVIRVVAWTPVFGSVLVLLSVFWLGYRIAGRWCGLVAAALLTLFPGGDYLYRSIVGFGDHHVAEVLLFVLSSLGLAAALDDAGDPPRDERRWRRLLYPWGRAALRASPLAALNFTWAGAPVYLAILLVVAWMALCIAVFRGAFDQRRASVLCRYAVALFLLVGLPALPMPTLVMVPDAFRPALAGMAAAAAAFYAAGHALTQLERRGVDRWGRGTVLLGAALIGTLVFFSIPTVQHLLSLAAFKTKIVREHKPIDLALIWSRLGFTPFLSVLAPAAILLARRRERASSMFVVVAALALTHLVVRVAEPNPHDCGGRLGRTARRRGLWLGAALAAALIAPFLIGSRAGPWPSGVKAMMRLEASDGAAFAWLREHTPEPPLPMDARVAPWDRDFHYPAGSYGVISGWENGNLIAAFTGRPVVASQGVTKPVIEWMLESDEAKSLEFWKKRCEPGETVRYVLLDWRTMGERMVPLASAIGLRLGVDRNPEHPDQPTFGPVFQKAIAVRLYLGGGSGLSHHRLIYESREQVVHYYDRKLPNGLLMRRNVELDGPRSAAVTRLVRDKRAVRTGDRLLYGPSIVPAIRIFEIVPGATIEGRAPAGAEIQAMLRLRSGLRGAQMEYRHSAHADEQGRFRLTVPYATQGVERSAEGGRREHDSGSDLTALGGYDLEALLEGRSWARATVAVSAEQADSGASVAVDLTAGE